MRRLFLAILFLILIILSVKQVSAQEACTKQCPPQAPNQISPTQCSSGSGGATNMIGTCPVNKIPSAPDDPDNCKCNPKPTGADACEFKCPGGTTQSGPTECTKDGTSEKVQITPTCAGGKKPSTSDPSTCRCETATTPPAPPTLPAAGAAVTPLPPGATARTAPDPPACGSTCISDSMCATATGGCTYCVIDPATSKGNCQNPSSVKKGTSFGLPCIFSTGITADPTLAPNPANGYDGFMTAIGCIPSKPQRLVEALIRYSSFAAGGIAFLLMILAALQMITAEGNPENIKHAQEKFYSAIIGLLLIIFSVLLMQVIGVDILGLPEFGPSVKSP